MTREEAIKFAVHAQSLADLPEVKEFYAFAESAIREQEERENRKGVDFDAVNNWIPVAERLPENETDVLILAKRRYCDGGTIPVISTAFHTDGKMNTEESSYNWDSDLDMQYDEENDAYIVPEGWWEVVNYGEEFGTVSDFVTHWMPLPESPKEDAP